MIVYRLEPDYDKRGNSPWDWLSYILARWPVSSLYILGLFLGIDLIMAGAGWIGLGFGLRRAR